MNFSDNPLCRILGTQYPLVQAGMIWCSGWELAAAVSESGGLGLIGSGSMYPDVLRQQIQKCKQATSKPFGVNVPMLYPDIEEHIKIIIETGVPVVFTSAGNPSTYTSHLKSHGIAVVHVVSNTRFAQKAEQAGVDAVVAEGFEAGGHNGREETTTLCLVPLVCKAVRLPVIAAGGIGSGRAMLAAFALGASGVQIGSRFVASVESSAHDSFKQKVIDTAEGETALTLKELTPVRLIKNGFYKKVEDAIHRGAGIDELRQLLGRGRAKAGMFLGDMEEGELEIGQVAGQIKKILPAAEIVKEIIEEFEQAQKTFC